MRPPTPLAGGGLYQFKHLSFQEAFFVEGLVKGDIPNFWTSNEIAAMRLNEPVYQNTVCMPIFPAPRSFLLLL